ncbi:MAG: tRNA pseudouridine(54/55) synthase Pus10 [Candidatus Bipolaricaulaceae bacterium]
MDPLDVARRLLAAGPVCDCCLGVQLAKLGTGLSARRRGQLIREAAGGGRSSPWRCWVCQGLFLELPRLAGRAATAVADYELDTFLFGVHPTPRLEAVQEFLDQQFPSPWAEPLRREINRELGRAFEQALAEQGRRITVDFRRPDVRFTVDLATRRVELHVASAYFAGRYRKLVRGIPQTHWPCRSCRGRGCRRCEFTGKQYPTSVEELVLPAFVAACRGEGGHLHGAGREDVDARMLGRGRPFVVEVLAPKVRRLDLAEVARRIAVDGEGRVEVTDLRPAAAELVAQVKALRAEKRYRAQVTFDGPVSPEELRRAVAGLVGEIAQRTPSRVSHRRADRVRRRRVYQATGEVLSPRQAEIEVVCDGGLYVKELVSGDQGRTRPSLAELVGVPARVCQLDVLEVLGGPG